MVKRVKGGVEIHFASVIKRTSLNRRIKIERGSLSIYMEEKGNSTLHKFYKALNVFLLVVQ